MLRAGGITAPYSSNAPRDFMGRRHQDMTSGSPIMRHLVPSLLLLAVGVLHAADTTDANRYVLPVAAGVVVKPIFTVGESPTASTYQMVGIPDGLGAYDNGDGTFTLLMNHELGTTVGGIRAHGNKGAFVSMWTISKTQGSAANNSWNATAIADFNTSNTSIYLWPTTSTTWLAGGTTAYARLCSADLAGPGAYWNPTTGKGTTARIFLSGEETGSEGRLFAHVATGSLARTSYELPHVGKYSWENAVASPYAQDATIVIGLDDSSPGQLYVYVGAKKTTGNDLDKAGLTGGNLYGVKAGTFAFEDRTSAVGATKNQATSFTLHNFGNVAAKTGATLQTESAAAGVTDFLRPEDGAWDPTNPADFYFVTTDRFDTAKNGGSGATTASVARSRLFRLRFTDLANPAAGGTITMLIDGSEDPAPQMMDNLCVDRFGRVIIQEDPGNQDWSARTWSYDIATGSITEVAKSDPARFGDRVGGVTTAAVTPFSKDDENSGIIDMSEILGNGWYLGVNQAHQTTTPAGTSDLVEGGQLYALFVPPPATSLNTAPVATADGLNVAVSGAKIILDGRFLAANDTDANSDRLLVTSVGTTTLAGASVAFIDGKIVYTPSTTAAAGATDTFTYVVRDGAWVTDPITVATPLLAAAGGLPVVSNTGLGSAIAGAWGRPWDFWLMTDRGANVDGLVANTKIFMVPTFTPRMVASSVNAMTGAVTLGTSVAYKMDATTNRDGLPYTGADPVGTGLNPTGETALDTTLATLASSTKGVDCEGLAMMSDGSFWQSDEYGPYLSLYNGSGVLQRQVNPFKVDGSGHKLPRVVGNRTANAGMEGLTVTPSGLIVGLMQRPLTNNDPATTATIPSGATGAQVLRLMTFNPTTGAIKQYAYVMGDPVAVAGAGTIGRVSALVALSDTEFLALERDGNFPSSGTANKKIWRFNLRTATDINVTTNATITDAPVTGTVGADYTYGRLFGAGAAIAAYKTLEELAITSPAAAITALTTAGVTPVTKTLEVDLISAIGAAYDHDKVEGLSVVGGRWLIVANDDDFGVVDNAGSYKAKIIPASSPAISVAGTTDYNQLLALDLARGLTATGTVTVTYAATGSNTAPMITGLPTTLIMSEDGLYELDFAISDAQTAANALTVSASSANATLVAATGLTLSTRSLDGSLRRLAIRPVANAAGGPLNITVAVSDGTATTHAVVALTLTAVNDAPVATNGTAEVAVSASVAITLVATDAEGQALTYSIFNSPVSGSGTLAGNVFTYVAGAGTGVASFAWQATDASGAVSNIATTSVTVVPAAANPDTPLAGDDDKKKCGIGSGVILTLGALSAALSCLGRFFYRRRI